MWIKVLFANSVLNAWQCPDDLLSVYGLYPLADGFVWAQLDADAPYRILKAV